ncbi:hypothetical protein [Cupriavidus basilensis]|uniref:hypothetical protein n=1 Tax=Cupriavidus basilensis TaxID=68895 RepID=UPI0009E36CE1|nr:hypothetical protein [Cupriavidus basilensis]
MQRIPKAILAAQLTTSAATYYMAPSGTVGTVNNLSFTNTMAGVVKVTVHRVPSSGSASAGNMLVSAYSLSPGQTYVPPQCIGLQLEPGMTLQALADTATAVTVMGGVYETSGS